jgi:hypothetical protein
MLTQATRCLSLGWLKLRLETRNRNVPPIQIGPFGREFAAVKCLYLAVLKIVRYVLFGSLVSILAGYAWQILDPENSLAIALKFFGWIIFLLAVGYLSTPTNSIYGKIIFGTVIIMILGVIMKILHLAWANEVIVISLVGILITYATMWLREAKKV